MRDIALPRPSRLEIGWGLFAAANLVAMALWEPWETIPFHFIWVSLTLLYGFRVWRVGSMLAVLGAVVLSTGALILWDVHVGSQLAGELTEVPLMSAMFLAMVWHARRRQAALREVEAQAEARAALLASQERFLHDASHELRTPVTIARGHLEVLQRSDSVNGEVDVALDELGRIERIVERLLLLAKADRPDFLALTEIELDALLENAVKHTGPGEAVELRSCATAAGVAIEVVDGGRGIPGEALDRIFERFGRADSARNRAVGGVGLGLSIVDAIARAHGGSCSVASGDRGSTFTLLLPRFQPVRAPAALAGST
jgi:signal transduction histidine kinase